MNDKLMYPDEVILKLSNKELGKIASYGAEYVLGMNIPADLMIVSGDTCALIGLVTGKYRYLLIDHTVIDDIIIDEWKKFVLEVQKNGYLRIQEIDQISTNISRRIKEKMINKKVVSEEICFHLLRKFKIMQSLGDILKNSEVSDYR